jgi:hypothetical protein
MSKNKAANPDRPRVEPLGENKIAESKGTSPSLYRSKLALCRLLGANQERDFRGDWED